MVDKDYNNYTVNTNSQHKYSLIERIGTGTYSEVFVAYSTDLNTSEQQRYVAWEKYYEKFKDFFNSFGELGTEFIGERKDWKKKITNARVIIKILKDQSQRRFKREVYILKRLNHPNIVKIIDVVENPFSCQKSLIFEFSSLHDTSTVFSRMIVDDVKLYARQMLEALQYAHKHDIVHRDIKPRNIVINPFTKKLTIIDWGLAERMKYCNTTKIGTIGYKAPELLFGSNYDSKIDVWAFGCVFAEMLFRKKLFTDGNNFQSIVNILGLDQADEYITKYNIPFTINVINYTLENKTEIINNIRDKSVRDILVNSLIYDKDRRYSCSDLLINKYF